MRTYICSKCKCKFTKHKDAQAMCPICGHVNSGNSSTFNHNKYYTSKNCSLNITEDIYCELVRPAKFNPIGMAEKCLKIPLAKNYKPMIITEDFYYELCIGQPIDVIPIEKCVYTGLGVFLTEGCCTYKSENYKPIVITEDVVMTPRYDLIRIRNKYYQSKATKE